MSKAGWPIHDDARLAKAVAAGFTPAQVPDIVAQWRKAEERKRKRKADSEVNRRPAPSADPPGRPDPSEGHQTGRVEVQAQPQAPEAERELAAPSLAMRCQRCGLVVPAPERPGHAARCRMGYDEHEARRWVPIRPGRDSCRLLTGIRVPVVLLLLHGRCLLPRRFQRRWFVDREPKATPPSLRLHTH